MDLLEMYKNKTVLVTGHTGFKGSWLSIWLNELGANLIGFSLPDWENDHLFQQTGLSGRVVDKRGDINDLQKLREVFEQYNPEVVFHMAAQPLVRDSYKFPVRTFDTNIMGTVNLLECVRTFDSVKAGVIITTDKCYKNSEQKEGYKESSELGGYDPYSASKAGAEIAIDSYRKSFFNVSGKLVASARSGNVIGGGDYSKDRIISDCIKSLKDNMPIKIRNPKAVRPWQHVLEPLYGYLLLGVKLLNQEDSFAEAWNFGPDKESVVPVSTVAELVIKNWGRGHWIDVHNAEDLHESKLLSLDTSKAKRILKWQPRWTIEKAVQKTIHFYKNSRNVDAYQLCVQQINEYSEAN